MGNWRSVQLEGTCDDEDLGALISAVCIGENYENFHSLCDTGGLCGLGKWPSTCFSVSGNVAERDYSIDEIARDAKRLLDIAPSLKMKIHCGGDYEDKQVVNTIVVGNGEMTIGEPEKPQIPEPSEDILKGRLFAAITGRRL